MKRILLFALLLAPNTVLAGTNFPALKDYPGPDCIKPGAKPVMAQDSTRVISAGGLSFTTGARDVKSYNEQVAAYNATLGAYTRCMDAYVNNAQSDMDAIRDRVNQAVAADKAP